MTVSTLITIASLITAVTVIITALTKIHKWFLKQEKQDAEIKKIKEVDIPHLKDELRVICTGVLACLDGLEQQGCNHSVPKAKAQLEEHINKVAHQ